jgi:hypothetical protein
VRVKEGVRELGREGAKGAVRAMGALLPFIGVEGAPGRGVTP